MLRRWPAIIAAFTVLLLGSGTLTALHELQHDISQRTCAPEKQSPAGPHDDSNCPIHAMLHAPVLAAGIELPHLGLSQTAEKPLPADPTVVSADLALNLSCRGPPLF